MPRVPFAKAKIKGRKFDKYRGGRENGKWKVKGEKKRRDFIRGVTK